MQFFIVDWTKQATKIYQNEAFNAVGIVITVRGVTRGALFPRAPNHCKERQKDPKMSQVLSSTQYICFQKTCFEHGVAKLAFCPGRHLTLLRPTLIASVLLTECVKLQLTCIMCDDLKYFSFHSASDQTTNTYRTLRIPHDCSTTSSNDIKRAHWHNRYKPHVFIACRDTDAKYFYCELDRQNVTLFRVQGVRNNEPKCTWHIVPHF